MPSTPDEQEPLGQIAAWHAALATLHARIAPHFARSEVRARRPLAGRAAGADRATQRLAVG